ncbi:ABC-F family ATP-binding cassette domain-containing protein [Tissierella sp. MB52-C2]|uniref:ABC-F family ATP-binding cassette domain-containing protein n=1 Tax=Tissierella sp. MB52-C2 TaxID=3070999 RepID=UPI00280C31F9|nr:ABC-F family ATP-binding cassette domain-containing protein [Tissierella sp. MB52-C2]WMM24131.1 ABC-F family ATP-binding cassette domain-containing protein [Tissierella sp. MB52-C2]
MLVLSCSNLTKTYIVDTILDSISFTVEDGDKIGVIGLNGSGKTTLFNILNGDTPQDSGDIYIQKGVRIGYLKQHTNIESTKTVFDQCLEVFLPLIKMEENLRKLEHEISLEGSKGESENLNILMEEYANMSEKFLSLNGYGYKSEIKGTLKGLGFKDEDLEKEVNVLSGGQKSRLSLAKLLLEKPDILLLDEPTNHLDIDAIDWLEKFLKDYKGAALIISHDRYFLDNVVNRIFHIEHLKLNIYNTNYTNFMSRRKKDLEIYQKHFENQQKEIKRQEEIIQRFKAYGGERYHGLAESRQKMLDKMKLLDKPMGEQQRTKIKFEPKIKSGRDVLRVENVEKSFGDFKLLKDINFNIYKGEKVGLIGANGIGKTTLFKIVLGELSKDGGEITLGHHVEKGYFDQEMTKLNLNKTIIDEIWDENPTFDHYQIRSILSQFMFIGDDIFKQISDLSGGEKGRLSLLKLMLSNANFLLMDEPTNHLDIDSKEVLEESIINYEGTLFVISHDRYFLNKVADKILELTNEGIKEYLGNYDYYLEKKNEVLYEEDEEDEKTKTQVKLEKRKEKELLKEEKFKRKEIKSLEEEISRKETQLEELDNILCDSSIYDKPEKVVELTKERESIQIELDNLYNQWILLTEE